MIPLVCFWAWGLSFGLMRLFEPYRTQERLALRSAVWTASAAASAWLAASAGLRPDARVLLLSLLLAILAADVIWRFAFGEPILSNRADDCS